jgi:ribosomal-protein-alanine N-acetyltransferase
VRTLTTERLLLRQWRDDDREPFAAMCADPEVMRYFPPLPTRDESEAWIENQGLLLDLRGWGLWPVEVAGGAPFVGFVGLAEPQFEAHFTPCVEIGWRLAREHWGRGYATEAARAAAAFAFDELGLDEIVALTVPANARSRAVMERLGMTRDPADDFEHPLLPPGHPLRRHVLYRLSRWRPSDR